MHIESLSVKNFRSLKDVEISDMSEFIILFGDNDTGKSNILAFLELVFQRKVTEEIIELAGSGEAPGGREIQQRETGFWEGDIIGFNDNFFRESSDPISFSIGIVISRDEFAGDEELPDEFGAALPDGQENDTLRFEGQIERTEGDRAAMRLASVDLNGRKVYDASRNGIERFLPGFEGIDPTVAEQLFERIVSRLDGAFLRIPANRYLVSETEVPRQDMGVILDPQAFKNWLFREGLSKDGQPTFRAIRESFESDPFNAGYLSVARIGDSELEIIVQDEGGFKLPIGRKGTGVQQILIILTYVLQSRASFVGIEELEVNLSPKSIMTILAMLRKSLASNDSPLQQLFLTTHSRQIAGPSDLQRIFVSLNERGETEISPADDAKVTEFLWPELE